MVELLCRAGGAKGVLGINPKLEGRKVILYRSMRKFESEDFGLHIANKFDRPLPLYLNRYTYRFRFLSRF